MAQIGRRVKTTQELLEDLKQRDGGSAPAAAPTTTDADDFRRSKTEHLAKFLNSQAEVERPAPAPPAAAAYPSSGAGSPTTRTVAQILSVLPPIDLSVLDQESDDEGREDAPPEQLLERVLAGDPVEGVTGNREEGEKTEQAFREWHESVWRRSFDGQPLFVWPYVITD